MSVDDGLVMQIHPGSLRNHNDLIFHKFGLDKGCDIPLQTEYNFLGYSFVTFTLLSPR